MAKLNVKRILDAKGWTQYKLSKAVGVSVAEVFRWVHKDCNPTLRTLNRIAEALGVKVSDLLEEDEPVKAPKEKEHTEDHEEKERQC